MYVRQVYREMCRGLEENALAYIPGGGVCVGGEEAREKRAMICSGMVDPQSKCTNGL